MHFDCRLSDPQVISYVFGELGGNDMLEHFPLARCDWVETRVDFGYFGLFSAGDSVSFDGGANGGKQIFSIHGLGEEIKRATFHRLHTFGNITVAGEKNNRKTAACFAQCCLKSKAVETRHREVK